MALAAVSRFLQELRSDAELRSLNNRQLLGRFCKSRDEKAFAALVNRHGPIVFSVCRRVLRNSHDAEDAFQATFLLLAQKAGKLRDPELIGPWLHGVAFRTAAKLRANTERRRSREWRTAIQAPASPEEEVVRMELQALLDDAIVSLPARYRVPIILCYLEGKTNHEAAHLLGCSRGTIATRLARARKLLQKRLTQKGVAVPCSMLATGLSVDAVSAIPISMRFFSVRLASPKAIALAKGVSRAMIIAKLKSNLCVLCGVLFIGVASISSIPGAIAQVKPESQRPSPENGIRVIPQVGVNPQTGRQAAIEPTVGQLLEYLKLHASRRQSIECLDVKLDLRQHGAQLLGLNGKLAAQYPNKVRMIASAFGNSFLEIGANDQEIWYWTWGGNREFRHFSREEIAKGKSIWPAPISPDWLLEILGMQRPDQADSYSLVVLADSFEFVQQLRTCEGQRMSKVTVFNRKASEVQVRAHIVRDEKGQEICSARILEGQKIDKETIPSRLAMSWPKEHLEIEITLQNIALNHPEGSERAAQLFGRPAALEDKK
jgi:RNA polymerase sigma factor (sigma-70 family)